MNIKNWLILPAILLFLVTSYFFISQLSTKEKSKDEDKKPTPTEIMEVFKIPSDWIKYEGKTVSFYHPKDWSPKEGMPFGGEVIEKIILEAPNLATDSAIFYSATQFDLVKPETVLRQHQIEFEGKIWIEWVREEDDMVSYDFFLNDIGEGVGSLVVHVSVGELDGKLEALIGDIVKTIEFIDEDKKNKDQE